MLQLCRKLVAFQFVLLACLALAHGYGEENRTEATNVKLPDLENDCEPKTAEAATCSMHLAKRLLLLQKEIPRVSQLHYLESSL